MKLCIDSDYLLSRPLQARFRVRLPWMGDVVTDLVLASGDFCVIFVIDGSEVCGRDASS